MSKLTDREEEILKILKTDPMISQDDLAELVSITRSAVAVHISNLIRKGYILGRGYVFNEQTGILVIGALYLDIEANALGDGSGLVEINSGGPGFELSAKLAGLDIPVSLVSVVGRDNWGEMITAGLKGAGVDTRYLIQTNEAPTPRRVILSEAGTENRTIADNGALKNVEYAGLQNMAVAVKNAGMVVAEADLPEETVRHLAEMAAHAKVKLCLVFFEDAARDFREYYEDAFLAVLPGTVAKGLSGTEIRDLDDAVEAGRRIAQKGIKWVAVVLPDEGIALAGKEEGFSLPLLPGHIEGGGISTGTLAAGLISGFFKGYELRQNARSSLGLATSGDGKSRICKK